MKKSLVAIFLSLAMILTACSSGQKNSSNKEENKENKEDKKVVYTSIYPIYDFTKKIAGDKLDVKLLVPNGSEPHGYELSSDDVKNIGEGNLFIYNGAGLESFIDKLQETLKGKVEFCEASQGVELMEGHHHHHDDEEEHDEEDHDHDHEHEGEDHNHDHEGENHDHEHEGEEHDHEHEGGMDPHVWISPKNAKIEMQNICQALIKLDSENETYYKENLENYLKELDALDNEFKTDLEGLENREIVVSHQAFGYLCRDYNLKQIASEGINAESEPDAKTIANIIDLVKNKGIKVIFSEELIDPKVAETIAKETGAKVLTLSPLEGLSEEQVKNQDDYFSIMKANLSNLLEALK